MALENKKITLDSNVWRDHLFISYLQSEKSTHVQHICPIIVYLETRLWYDMNGLSHDDFDLDLKNLRTKVIDFSKSHVEFIVDITKKTRIPFRQHARGFMIGSIVQSENSLLITNNKKHFDWLPSKTVLSPKEYLSIFLNI